MGTWNATCAISQLPILEGEPARLLLLRQSLYPDISQNEGRDMLAGPATLWTPRAIPIRGTYDGYGCIEPEDAAHWTTQLATARFRLDLIEEEGVVLLDSVLNGCTSPHSGKPMSGIEWVQALIRQGAGRLRVLVPKWLDSEEDREKLITACLIRTDIYDALANTLTDDNYGHGRTPDSIRKMVRNSINRGGHRLDKLQQVQGGDNLNTFIKPRTLGHASRTLQRMPDLFDDDEREALTDLASTMESTTRERFRTGADRFAEDYAAHLLACGVGCEDPTIESIITEVAAFTQVSLHMEMLNRFWHPQPTGQHEGWISHTVLATKTLELAKRHIREEEG